MIKRILVVLLIVCTLVISATVPAMAIAQPDTPSMVNGAYVFENCLETGDRGILIDYYIDYTATPNPTESATLAYMAIFIDHDGVTQLRSVAPYNFVDAGYGRGLMWIYFSAADSILYDIKVAEMANYRIWITGNPLLTWVAPVTPPLTIATLSYWEPVGASTPVVLAQRVLNQVNEVSLVWVAAVLTTTLIDATSSGFRLSANGAAYMAGVIPNLQTMAPNCYASGSSVPITEDIDFTTEVGATMTNGPAPAAVAGSPITFTSSVTTGTADLVGAPLTTALTDDMLTQANDYWNGARLTITRTTDGAAPEGQWKVVTDFDAASNTLTFGALTAAVHVGDKYELVTGEYGTVDTPLVYRKGDTRQRGIITGGMAIGTDERWISDTVLGLHPATWYTDFNNDGVTNAGDVIALQIFLVAFGDPFNYNPSSSSTTSLCDISLVQEDNYWNGAQLIIVSTTDGAPPQGEKATVTLFRSLDNHLEFAALTAAVDEGDTYVLGCTDVVVTVAGSFTMVLSHGTAGILANHTGTVTSSPIHLTEGTSTVAVTGIGTFTLVLYATDTKSNLDRGIVGTGFDMTNLAARFGMSRWMFSGLIWLLITVIICAALYSRSPAETGSGTVKIVMLVFDVCIIGGVLLGLMHPVVGALLFLGFSAITGYALFFQKANV